MIEEKLGECAIGKTLGSGTMGTVYKAENRNNGQLVAIKLIRSQVLFDADMRKRFLQSVLAASQIKHKNICPILEIGDDDDDFYVISPFLEGTSLQQRLGGRPLPLRDALDIAQAVAEALAAIHAAGFAHRGLKPANIWIRPDASVRVTDCGLTWFSAANPGVRSRHGRAASAVPFLPAGTGSYMSPEQIRGEAVDQRTDIYSWGVIFYEMVTGCHPFGVRASSPRRGSVLEATPLPASSRVPGLPHKLDGIFRRVLARSPDARPQGMQMILGDLQQLRRIYAAPAAAGGTVTRARAFNPSTRVLALALAVLLAILAVLVYYFRVR